MTSLHTQLQQITSSFLSAILAATRQASVSELSDYSSSSSGLNGSARPARGRGGRSARTAPAAAAVSAPVKEKGGPRHRATAAEVQKLKQIALGAAKALRSNFSKGEVMRKTGSKIDLGRALTLLVAEGKLKKQGDRRLTRYSLK